MKKHLLKTMLVATGLLTSAVSTWAQSTGTADVKMTYVDYNNAETAIGEIASGETAKTGYNKISSGTVGWGFAGWNINYITYIQVDASKIEGKVTNATLSLQVSGATDSKRKSTYGVGFNSTDWSDAMTYTSADKSITTLGNTATTSTTKANVFETKTFDITNAFKDDEDKIVTIIVYATTAAGGYIKNPTATITTAAASSITSYSVKYVNEQRNEIKTSKSYEVTIGDDATATSEDMASFFKDDKKYIYKSGNTTIKAAEDAIQNVITLVFRKAETWDYTVNASVNGETKELVSGFDFEGESVAYNYPQYFNVDGVLYEASKGSTSEWYKKHTTLDTDNKNITIDYKATSIKNVVYFSEAEDIEGLTGTSESNADIRCSNGKGGYNASETEAKVTTLPAGEYIMNAVVWGNAGQNILVKYGESDIWSMETKGYIQSYNKSITLNKTTDISIPQCGDAGKMLDYLYIQKVGDVATISSAEYATYVTTSAVKVPENVKVLTVKANATGIETAELAAGTVIPAGTAVVLNAEAGDYTLELADEAGTKPADNDLTPATADITADGTQYCLTQNEEGKVGFAKVKAEVNIPAGKAYLVVNNEAAANFFALDGSTTAIKNVEAAQTADNAYYTLQGVKVERPAKGIYIKNGKKVVIK